MIINIVTFIFVLSLLVFFHELGHFIVARLFGVGIEKFSIGFGPRLVGFKFGFTDYRISAIPLGGYVKMVGDDVDSKVDDEMFSFSFVNKHVFKKILIVLAGPAFNIILSIIVFFIIFTSSGLPSLKPIVGEVITDMPAFKNGIKSGDVITFINNENIENWDDIANIMLSSNGSVMSIGLNRNNIYSNILLKPRLIKSKDFFGQEINKYAMGIVPSGDLMSIELNYFESIRESFIKTYDISRLTFLSIIKLLQGVVSTKTMGGPVMIAEMAGDHARTGFISLMFFVSLLSINLAVLNCLPIPILDGGHLLFFIIEAIIKKPVNNKIREIAQQVGSLILLLLMIYVFYNDLARLFLD